MLAESALRGARPGGTPGVRWAPRSGEPIVPFSFRVGAGLLDQMRLLASARQETVTSLIVASLNLYFDWEAGDLEIQPLPDPPPQERQTRTMVTSISIRLAEMLRITARSTHRTIREIIELAFVYRLAVAEGRAVIIRDVCPARAW